MVISALGPRSSEPVLLVTMAITQGRRLLAILAPPPSSTFTLAFIHLTMFIERQLELGIGLGAMDTEMNKDIFSALP